MLPSCFSNVDHRCVARSKIFKARLSPVKAAIDLPSGDQRGEKSPADPVSEVTRWVATSRMRMFVSGCAKKTTLLPSGDQPASSCDPLSSGKTRIGLPPCEGIEYITSSPFEAAKSKKIRRVPSG